MSEVLFTVVLVFWGIFFGGGGLQWYINVSELFNVLNLNMKIQTLENVIIFLLKIIITVILHV